MKKVIFTLVITFFLLMQGIAQITVNYSDVAAPSTKFQRYNDTLPAATVVPGNAGASQTWNLSTIHHDNTDTLIFANPQWTPYGSSYPTSNLCLITINSSSSYSYMKNSADSLSIIGQAAHFMGSATPIVVKLNPAQKLMDFPSTYLSSYNNFSKFQVVQYYGQVVSGITIDSVRVRDKTTITSHVDGWGNLTTPLGTYNSLRAVITQIEQDSVWVKSSTFGPSWFDFTSTYGRHDTTKRYSWWANNLGFVLAEIYVNPHTDSVISANYLGTLGVHGGIDELNASDNSNISPNPATDMILVSSDMLIKNVSIYDVHGAMVKSEDLNKLSENIMVSGLPKGLYIVRMTGNKGENLCVKKLVID